MAFNSPALLRTLFVIFMLAASGFLGIQVGLNNVTWVILFFGVALLLIILKRPEFGLALVVASTLLVDVLPDVPLLTSSTPLIGGIVLGILILRKHARREILIFDKALFITAGMFIAWMILSSFDKAIYTQSKAITWYITFIQLLILLWLAGNLLEEQTQMVVFMIILSIIGVISALTLVIEFLQISSVNSGVTMLRFEGIGGSINRTARYLVVIDIILFYLINKFRLEQRWFPCLFSCICVAIVTIGLLATGSRTGIILLVVGVLCFWGYLFTYQNNIDKKISRFFMPLSIIILLYIVIANTPFVDLFGNVIMRFTSVDLGQNTVQNNVRFDLWWEGINLWIQNPVSGVGIGRFVDEANTVTNTSQSIAHNSYITVLAETGTVGFFLFLAMNVIAIHSFVHTLARTDTDNMLVVTWLITHFVLILGALSANDHYDRLVWFVLGVSQSWVIHKRACLKKETLKLTSNISP